MQALIKKSHLNSRILIPKSFEFLPEYATGDDHSMF